MLDAEDGSELLMDEINKFDGAFTHAYVYICMHKHTYVLSKVERCLCVHHFSQVNFSSVQGTLCVIHPTTTYTSLTEPCTGQD